MNKAFFAVPRPVAAAWCLAAVGAAGAASPTTVASLADLSLEQLGSIEVTSVSGRPESLQEAPASIYVITGEDIRRSAATTLPQALRLAPNLQVAQLNSGQWAVSARGFNNAIGNKLLVLVDGRTIYSALFSGVFWDANDVVLEDVERIEVISGPGGTLWGANAVNGVINVITRAAADTQGLLASVTRSQAGGQEVARWGGTVGGAHYRAYALALDRNNTVRADRLARADASAKRQLGFRADWGAAADGVTVQGDVYEAGKLPATNLAPQLSGGNLLARWSSSFADGSPFKLQAYADHTDRDETATFRNQADTVDLQFTHEPAMPAGHQLLWGAGHRRTRDDNDRSAQLAFIPARRHLSWTNVFAQHEVALAPALQLTLGAKAERNVYTGTEFLPSARLAYKSPGQRLTWLAASRAVRAPARLDKEFFVPATAPFLINGGLAFVSEIAHVLEAGHRGFVGSDLSYSLTLFQQRYERLRSGSATVPATLENKIAGSVNGLEGWASWQATSAWRLSGGFVELRKHLRLTDGSRDTNGIANLGNDPRHQWTLRSSLNFAGRGEFDLMARHSSALPSPAVPRYTAVDGRLAWKIQPGVEASLLVHNLFDRRHVEFNDVSVASQIERRVLLRLAWQF